MFIYVRDEPDKGGEDGRADGPEEDKLCLPVGQVQLHLALH